VRDDHVGVARHLPLAPPHERLDQVDGDRPLSGGAGRPHLPRQRARRERPDRAESAGFGHGRRQPVAGQPAAHPGLHDRELDAEALEQSDHGLGS
jgi:hypothetical protein